MKDFADLERNDEARRYGRNFRPIRTCRGSIASDDGGAPAPSFEAGGQLTLGALPPIKCVAIANDDDICYAMLQRRPEETLQQLLVRLDAAIDLPWTTDQYTDEINPPSPKTKR